MPLGDSVWFPRTVSQTAVLVVVALMIVLHQSELLGLMNAGILFGWLPVQLAYDLLFLLVGVVILFWIARVLPDQAKEYSPTDQTDGSAAPESATITEK